MDRKGILAELEKNYNTIYSSTGGIVDGRIKYCGYDVTTQVAGKMTQIEASLLWLLGREPSQLETKMLDALICVNTYTDLRIWSIRTGAYASAMASPISSCFGISHASFDAKIFGSRPILKFYDFIKHFRHDVKDKNIEEVIDSYIERKVFFHGFGRPLIQGMDERFRRIRELIEEWNYPVGDCTKLLFSVYPVLIRKKNLFPNYASIFSAVLADPPFSLNRSKLAAVSHFMINLASYLPACEIMDRPKGTPLLPLKVSDLIYQGVPARKVAE